MIKKIEFVSNYNDLSTNQGYQFEFYCDRCSSGYRTEFEASISGSLGKVLDIANSLLGGALHRVTHAAETFRSAGWEQAHDKAFQKAVEDIKPHFIQCPKCLKWICRDKCWNIQKGLCKECAPDLGVEMAAAQSNKSVEEIWAHAAMAEEDKKLSKENWREIIVATCPKCETHLDKNVKFCPNCGENLRKKIVCPACGNELNSNVKFCPECGKKLIE